MQKNDETGLYDRQIVLREETPFYQVAFLLMQLGYVIHPKSNYLGQELPAWSNENDEKAGDREEYISYLTSELIKAVNRRDVVIKSSIEKIIEPPVGEEGLKNAIIYKSQVPIFTRLVRIKTIFKPSNEMFVVENFEGKECLRLKPYSTYITPDTEIKSERSPPESLRHDINIFLYDHRQIEEIKTEEDDSGEACTVEDPTGEETDEPKLVDDAQVETAANSIAPHDEKVENVNKLHLADEAKDREVDDSKAVDDDKTKKIDRSRLATSSELAEAFKIKTDDAENRKWFKQRCSDAKKYNEFLTALTVPGKRKPGYAGLFDVLVIVDILLKNKKRKETRHLEYFRPPNYLRYLRGRVKSTFPKLLEEFDTRFGTSE